VAGLEVVPFSDEHLDDAGRLLAARHARQREVEPLLPQRFEDPAASREEIERSWRADDSSGAAALRDGRLVGYLIAGPRDAAIWGDNVWVELAGHAVEEPEDARDLYANAAAHWVEQGRTRHYALMPTTDPALIDSWFRLGFGQQQAHAVQEVRAGAKHPRIDGLEIRRPAVDEIDSLIELDLALPRHQRSAPVFSDRPLPSEQEIRDEWIDTLARDEEDVLVAFRDGKPLACWSVVAAELSSHFRGLAGPERACYLAYASTLPEARGSGIGVALTNASLARAAERGDSAIVTDWRVTNLLASRFWPKRGFRPVFLRLYRSIP
jgi:ribosomal protein S18 acetylase RimI-like enzyme